jgi:hypothetical protein
MTNDSSCSLRPTRRRAGTKSTAAVPRCAILWSTDRQFPRFRTIQVWPKDLPAPLRQVERAADRRRHRKEARCPT